MKTVNVNKIAKVLFSMLILSMGFGMVYIDVGFAIKPYMLVSLIILVFLIVTRNIKIQRLYTVEKSWLVFMIACFLTVFQFKYVSSNIRYIFGFTLIFVFYFIFTNLLSLLSKEDIEKTLINCGIVLSVITIGYYILGLLQCGMNFHGNGEQYYGVLMDRGTPRLVSLLSNDPNITAFYFSIFFYIFITKIKGNFKNKFGAFLTTMILILTFSRGAYLAIGASLIIVFLTLKGRNLSYKLKRLVGILIIAIAIIYAVLFTTNINIVDIVAQRFQSSAVDNGSGRTILWKNALKTFDKNPIWGIGINSTLEYNYTHYGTTHYVHNTYLEVLSETGIVGTIPYLLFIIAVIVMGWKVYIKNNSDLYLWGTALATLLQMVFLSILLNEMMYVFLAILVRYSHLNEGKHENEIETKNA